MGFSDGTVVKNPPANAGDSRDSGSTPVSGRYAGGRNGSPLQYFCLKSSMDWGAWRATAHGVTKSQTRLSDKAFTFSMQLQKEVLFLWRHLPKYLVANMGSQTVGHDWNDLACKQNVITSAPYILKKDVSWGKKGNKILKKLLWLGEGHACVHCIIFFLIFFNFQFSPAPQIMEK